MTNITDGMSEFFERKKYTDLKNVFREISGINYAVVKGVPLKLLCGGGMTALYSDVDILTDRKSIGIMNTALNRSGYYNDTKRESRIFALTSSHQTMPYSKIYSPHEKADVNFDIFWGEYKGKRIDIDKFLSDTVETEIYGVKVKTLPPLKAMIQLILHHYKDMNSIFLLATRKSIKYDMFRDVYHLLKNNSEEISLEKLYAMSEEYEIIPYVFYILHYTGQIFDDDILRRYTEAFATPDGKSLLGCYGLSEEERKEWKCDFKTRLNAENLYDLIKDDLTEKDKEKIALNKRFFSEVSE